MTPNQPNQPNQPIAPDPRYYKPAPTFTPNEQQLAVREFCETGTGSLNLVARAGTGKTSTLVYILQFLRGLVFLGAFNKAIADELAARVGRRLGTEVSTWHSLGLRICRSFLTGEAEIDSTKVLGIARKLAPYDRKYAAWLRDCVSFAKQSGFGLDICCKGGSKDWTKLLDHYEMWDELQSDISPDKAIRDCKRAYETSLEIARKESRIDYDDMLLLPLFYVQKQGPDAIRKYDWVLIDEAQDSNRVRRELALAVLRTGGRLISVGDDRQAIYGFAGASNDAMDQIKAAMKAVELPLNVTYRCPKKVVAMAQQWVPDIQAHDSAPDGEVETIPHVDFWASGFTSRDVILCRNTRPLIGIAQRLRKQGVDCVVEGNSSRALLALIMRWGDVPVGELLVSLGEYSTAQENEWRSKGRLDKWEVVSDRIASVRELAAGVGETEPARKLVQKVESLFGNDRADDGSVLRLCTIHRSKGREWDRVFLVGRNKYQPSKWATAEWEVKQEENLEYVAVTRSKRALVEVTVPEKDAGPDELQWWEV